MSGNGRGENNRRNHPRFGKKEDTHPQKQQDIRSRDKISGDILADGKLIKNRQGVYERPVWSAPVASPVPISTHICPWCGKPINDLSAAITDKTNGEPVHFECVLARLNETETLESNDTICYIGGGRFGIVHYNNPQNTADFEIKKIFEWESKDSRSEWRRVIGERFSVT